jgi:hypothetical protein
MIFFSLMSLAGFAMFLGVCHVLHRSTNVLTAVGKCEGTNSKAAKYGSLFLSLPGSFGLAPTLSTWNANNAAPHVRRATAIAIAFIMTNSGGILATWLLGALSPAPKYTKATATFIVFSVVVMLASAANLWYLKLQNRKKEIIRTMIERNQEPEGLGDGSAWFVYSL